MKFTPLELKNFNQLFEDQKNAGYVLDFTNKTMREFFESELSIDIDNGKMATPKSRDCVAC